MGLVLGACVEITIIIILGDHPLFYLACGLFTMITLYGITVIKSADQSALKKQHSHAYKSYVVYSICWLSLCVQIGVKV